MSEQNHKRYLDGKVAFITGAGSGIGRETALQFARKGANVALVGMTASKLEETAKQIAALDNAPETLVIPDTNVGADAAVFEALSQVADKWGRLDIAFNNAGMAPEPTPFTDVRFRDFHFCMEVNLGGIWNCMQHQIPMMKASGGGYIVNNSSVAGLIGFQNNAAYCTSKHAVIGLTRSVALEVAKDNIFVNAICPGPITTDLIKEFAPTDEITKHIEGTTAVGRYGKTADIARMVVKMCDPEITFMVGSAVTIDGGQTAGY